MNVFSKTNSLKFNMQRSILLTALFCTFLVTIVAYTLICNHQWNTLTAEADAALEKTRIFINGDIMAYINNSIALASDPDLINILNQKYSNSMEIRTRTLNEISKYFTVINAAQTSDSILFIIYTDNETIYKNKYINDINKITDDSLVNRILSLSFSDILWQNETKTHLVFYRGIDTYPTHNILRVQIPLRDIDTYIQSIRTSKYIISYGKAVQKGSIYENSLELLNGKYITVGIPLSVKYRLYFFNLLITCSAFLLLSIIMFIITSSTTKRMTKNINIFIEDISKDDSLLNPSSVTAVDYDEFILIKQRIIKLLQDQNMLHNKLRESTEHIKKIELELLQCRFNPHLLYNTLSVLKWNIMRGMSKNSAKVIDILSDYYRKILNQESIEIPLEQEASLLKQYVQIMEFALSETYTFLIDIDPSLLTFPVIKHSLQPLLENAILHGVSQKSERIIKLKAMTVNNAVKIIIKDNGRGISPERLSEIRSANYTSIYKSYGIKNTINSFKTHFGKEYFSFLIESTQDLGTTVTLTVFENVANQKNNH